MNGKLDQRNDYRLITQVIAVAARKVRQNQGGPFAAFVCGPHGIIATGWNQVTGKLDPTAHAEIMAIRKACKKLATFNLSGHLLVSSCEPCPMCWGAAAWARVDRIIFAADRNDAAAGGFDDREFYRQLQLPLAERSLSATQIQHPQRQRPFDIWLANSQRVEY